MLVSSRSLAALISRTARSNVLVRFGRLLKPRDLTDELQGGAVKLLLRVVPAV